MLIDERVIDAMDAPDDARAMLALMNDGLTPSTIDALMGYEDGTAHDIAVDYWRIDTEQSMEARRDINGKR